MHTEFTILESFGDTIHLPDISNMRVTLRLGLHTINPLPQLIVMFSPKMKVKLIP